MPQKRCSKPDAFIASILVKFEKYTLRMGTKRLSNILFKAE